MINGLDLCTGIGGITEALAEWVRPIAYCEKDPDAQAQLISRIERGEFPNAPIWDDITTLRGRMLPRVDIVYGGFPCQSVSLAGARKGMVSEQSGLFFHVARIVKETSPQFVFLENVWPGIRKYVPMVRNSLEALGYSCRDGVLAAEEVGARHRRQRWFLLANLDRKPTKRIQLGRGTGTQGQEEILSGMALEARDASDAQGVGRQAVRTKFGNEPKEPFGIGLLEGDNWDEYAAFFLRVDNGLPHRGKRIKSLGNTNPPIQFKTAFKIMMNLHSYRESK